MLFTVGDAITQKVIQKKTEFDYKRNLRIGMVGLLFAGPIYTCWYEILMPNIVLKQMPKYFPRMKNFSYNKNLFTMIFIDQTLFSVFFIASFFMLMSLSQSGKIEDGVNNVKNHLKDTVIVNWQIWPGAQALNFTIVPLRYRVLFANLVGLMWDCYLSYVQFQN